MKVLKGISRAEIGERIKQRKNFTVRTANERKKVLECAAFLGVMVSTKATADGFNVYFINS